MIAKIKQGKGFGGLVSYANDIKNKDTNIIASEGVDLSTNKSIVASFNIQAKARPTLKAYVGHISLSFSPEDYKRMSDELIAEISRKYLQRMGIVNTQFVIFRHHDKAHDHVHIVYNRVDNDGNAITGDSNFKKSAAINKALTREYGLTFGKGKKNVNRDRLKGKDAARECDIAIRERNPFDTSVRPVYKVHSYTFLGKSLSKAIPSTTVFQCCGNEVIHSVLGGILAFQLLTVHILLAFAKCQAVFPCECLGDGC